MCNFFYVKLSQELGSVVEFLFSALLCQSNQIIPSKHKIKITYLQCSSTEVEKNITAWIKTKVSYSRQRRRTYHPFHPFNLILKKKVQRAKSICSETKALRCIFKTRCKFPRTVRFRFNVFLGSLRGLVKF